MDLDRIAEDWRARDFTGGLWVDPPGQRWEGYVHGVDELVMVVDGAVELELPGKNFRPAPGEEILIPAGVIHSVRNVGTVTSRWRYGYREA